jgi:hypothetical protein
MKKLAIGIVIVMLVILLGNYPIKSDSDITKIYDYNTVWIYNQQKKDSVPNIDVNLRITMPFKIFHGQVNILIKQTYPEKSDWQTSINGDAVDFKKPENNFWRAEENISYSVKVPNKGIYQLQATLLIDEITEKGIKQKLYCSNIQDFYVDQRQPYFLETPKDPSPPLVVIESMTVIQRTEDVLFRVKTKPIDIDFENTFFFIDVFNNTLPLLSYKLGKENISQNYCDFIFDWVAPKALFFANYNMPLTFKIRAVEHEKDSPIIFYGENYGELIIPH